jgi:hypothetical protein
MALRIYADFNSVTGPDATGREWCWCLLYKKQPLDDVAAELGLVEGMPVTLFYTDPSEELEVDGILSLRNPNSWGPRWHAQYDKSAIRRIR